MAVDSSGQTSCASKKYQSCARSATETALWQPADYLLEARITLTYCLHLRKWLEFLIQHRRDSLAAELDRLLPLQQTMI